MNTIDPSLHDFAARSSVDLSSYDNGWYFAGRNRFVCTLWYFVSLAVFESGWVPLLRPKRWLLRLFGARIGRGLVIKPQVWIKYPWRLAVGDYCWIGKGAWIDNLADVQLGSHVCVSQQVYICTGSHDRNRPSFDLITRPVEVGNGAWLGQVTASRGRTGRRQRGRGGRQRRQEGRAGRCGGRRKSGPAACSKARHRAGLRSKPVERPK